MTINCTFKDFKETQKISKLFTISDYAVYAGTNFYGGKEYEYILFFDKKDLTLDSACLFNIYDGRKLGFTDESLLIPNNVLNTAIAMFSSNYMFTTDKVNNMWQLALFRINECKETLKLNPISLDIPVIKSLSYENIPEPEYIPAASVMEIDSAPINKATSKKKKKKKKK